MKIKKAGKFIVAYYFVVAVYYLFDFVYMPWLTLKFGYLVFLPLYPSILVANFLGLYAYDYFDEDVFFLEIGRNWIENSDSKLESVKKILRKSKKLIFVSLSIWPSPIAGYLFFRKKKNEPTLKILGIMATGSIFCTAFWGGGLSILYFLYMHVKSFFIALY